MNDTPAAKSIRPPPRRDDFPYFAPDMIRLGDLDHQNHVNNAVYATYFETGRVMMMREAFGGRLNFGTTNFVVARLEINYLRELRWPGTVEIGTGVERMGRSSVVYAQAIFRDGICAASGRTIMALIDTAARKAVPMPDEVLAMLAPLQMRVRAAAN